MREKAMTIHERLRGLAEFLPLFEKPGFIFGEWTPPQPQDDGSFVMRFYSLSETASSFIHTAYELGCVLPDFDWPSWKQTSEAAKLCDDRDALAKATPEQTMRLLTVLIRQGRFCEGALAAAYESGLLTRILRRSQVLAAHNG